MSINHIIYLRQNGEILRAFNGPPADVEHQLAEGELACEGTGSWTTHRVDGGQLVLLPEPRTPPFEGAHWDSGKASWFDPLRRKSTAPQARAAAKTRLLAKLADIDQSCSRAMREIFLSTSTGQPAPEAAVVKLREGDVAAARLRSSLAALG